MSKSSKVVARLQKQSSDALGIFKSTINRLVETNQAIDKEMSVISLRMAEDKADHDNLEGVKNENAALVGKIEQFLV